MQYEDVLASLSADLRQHRRLAQCRKGEPEGKPEAKPEGKPEEDSSAPGPVVPAESVPRPLPAAGKLTPAAWWASMGSPRHILAPMVGQSELAFRLLCRKHGTTLCYTPMFISGVFARSKSYRKRMWQTCKADRPLLVQFCGNEPETLVRAALKVQDDCDGVDLNLGCPQAVAKRGNYGAWLMERKNWPVRAP